MEPTGSAARSAERAFGATIRDALLKLNDLGYTGSMRVDGPRVVQCLQCRAGHDPARLSIEHLARIEGASDPADEEAIVALTCPACRSKSTLVLTYGTSATAEEGEVFFRLQDERH